MVQRLTYRKRHSYATKSNQHRVVKTPGGKLVYQTTKKRASGPKCPVTGKRIQGFFCMIIRAFLVEEQKIVKKVLKIQKAKEKLAAKS
ncbi:hypothetical protein DH2020_032578 [Rehmannia glutinosa]|uniref:60S ribosomal protein L34 n=1 Tax=Rehmannia glutinosa TaxID=99300 RepID=A0ABR0VGF6_REHGL